MQPPTPVTDDEVRVPAAKGQRKDLLGRRALADALADKLYDHSIGSKDVDPGPTVVTIEGPWGSGKSTLLDLVRERLPDPPRADLVLPRLTVRGAASLLRGGEAPEVPIGTGARGVVTAWFNPWAHQSGEQVWAGLVAEIIEAAQPVLYPTEAARERYWLGRNLSRIDRYALRRTLHRRMLSPELTLGALGVVASLAIAIAELETTVSVAGFRVQTAMIALMIASTFLLLGGVHTGLRFLRSPAARYLPGELFHGPVTAEFTADMETSEGMTDPLRRARAGSLYLHQHHVSELVADLDRAGYELIVFVDDLDRCRADTLVEVFEAINLFLSGFVTERRGTGRENPGDPGGSLRARFVIGVDPVVVARHLDEQYKDHYDPAIALDGEDPSAGWAFLRRLVHLPVLVPQVSDSEMLRILGQIAGVGGGPTGATAQPAADSLPGRAWRLPDHPEIDALVRRRLAAQPDHSIREATRQLNTWEFYERVLAITEPLTDDAAALVRSSHLVILAELVTRWPALQRFLHRSLGEHTGLQRLAATVNDDAEWGAATEEVFAGRATSHADALTTLRKLLREHDGRGVADLATKVL